MSAARGVRSTLDRCAPCAALGEDCAAHLHGGGALPEAALRLEGIPQDLSRDDERIVLCRQCRTPYRYECSAGFGEHHVSVTRASLEDGRDALGEATYAELLAGLPALLEAPSEPVQLYAARSLARHHVAEGDTGALVALLAHPIPRVRAAVGLTVRVHAAALAARVRSGALARAAVEPLVSALEGEDATRLKRALGD